jgi:hypothetical protein
LQHTWPVTHDGDSLAFVFERRNLVPRPRASATQLNFGVSRCQVLVGK